MNDPQNREASIFEAALQLPPARRGAHLDEACGDDADLRKRVELLLKSHEEAGDGFLVQPPRALGFAKTVIVSGPLPAEEQLGTMIGRYKLLEKVGEGGFGVVYVAEQREPVKRRVALKIIKLGMDTRQVVARFEAERQALAMMDHPNIAKVFDAGATETGRPYFVMELVRGIRITDYCDQNHLSTRERLELFTKVCQAIQHAHQKGIIHRDIKPSNILVTLHDGVPVPKVIDFGIAKATQGELTEKTVYTQLQQFIGTPAYMSPEQAEMSGLDIDTRSDIYSLGVLLYELLTGKTPFDQQALMSAGLDGMRRMIREQEPLRPSTRVSSLQGEERTTTAKRHGLDAPKLVHLLRGDLDWIVMKCLEKDRTRRYETANGVAMDLGRYLSHEPVVARPPSAAYRFHKFTRRNKLAFAAASAVAGALCLGFIASTWQAVRATREQRIADRERARSQTEAKRADENAAAEARQRRTAEQATHRTKQALSASVEVEGDRLAQEGSSAKALAHFARALRLDPANRVAAQRIVALLNQRDFPLPMAQRPAEMSFEPLDVLAYSFDLRRYCVRTNGASVAVFDGADGHMIGTPLRFESRPVSAGFSQDGLRLAVGLTNQATFWATESGRKLAEVNGELESISRDNRLAIVSDRVLEVDSGREFFRLPGRRSRSRAVFSPDGQMLAFVTDTNDATEVLFTTNGQPVLSPMPTFIRGARPFVRFSPDSRHLINSTSHGFVEVWDLVQRRQSLPTLPHGSSVWVMTCSEDGRLLAAGGRNGQVHFWNLLTGQPAREPCLTREVIETMYLAPDNSWLTTRGFTISLSDMAWDEPRWWDLRPGRALPMKLFHPASVDRAVYSADGALVLTVCADGAARIWRAQDGVELGPPFTHRAPVSVAGFNPDSTLFATGGLDGEICLWATGTDKEPRVLGSHPARVTALAFSPDGRFLASGAEAESLMLWDVASGELLGEQHARDRGNPYEQRVTDLTCDRTGKRLAVCYCTGRADLFELPTLRRLTSLTKNQGAVFAARYSPDGKWLVTSSANNSAQLWDALSGEGPKQLYPHESGVFMADFNANGRLLATASYDNSARIWETLTGKPVTEPLQHQKMVYTAFFNPDDRTVLTASLDGSAVVWDVATGRPVSEKYLHEDAVYAACFSPDGRHILTAGKDGVAAIHDWVRAPDRAPAWLPELAEAVGGFRLTETGVSEYVPNAAQILARLRQTLTNAAPSDDLATWGQWFLADRRTRTISPFARVSMPDYAARLAQGDSLAQLEEALDLGARTPTVYLKLAALVEAIEPQTAQLYRRLAAELGGGASLPAAVAARSPAPSALPAPPSAKSEFLDPCDNEELLKHQGQSIRVRGRIVGFGASRTSRYYYLNFAENFRSALTLFFDSESNPAQFRSELLRSYVGKPVAVEGVLVSFQGRPEFIMKSLSQIKIEEFTGQAERGK